MISRPPAAISQPGSPVLARSQVSWSPASFGSTKYRNATAESTKRPKSRMRLRVSAMRGISSSPSPVSSASSERYASTACCSGSSRIKLSLRCSTASSVTALSPYPLLEELDSARHARERRRDPRCGRANALGQGQAGEEVDDVVLAQVHEREPEHARVRPPDGAGTAADLAEEVGRHDGCGEVQRRHGSQRVPPHVNVERAPGVTPELGAVLGHHPAHFEL